MKLIIQYVSQASITVNKTTLGKITTGYAVLVGFGVGDSQTQLQDMTKKLLTLRTIPDKNNRINLSIQDIQGDILLIPQFTLYADTNRGHRPSFSLAAPPKQAKSLFCQFTELVRQSNLNIQTGEFGAHMNLTLTNQGPITITLEND